MQKKDKPGAISKLAYRKTSAEIVSEARNSLIATGSVKLVSTRRPITPNVNKRQLYGDTLHPSHPGRPPSAFNLKYLQYETRALPCLEPISDENEAQTKRMERSGSLGTIQEATSKTKLPALPEAPKLAVAGSLENCKYLVFVTKLGLLKKDLTGSRVNDILCFTKKIWIKKFQVAAKPPKNCHLIESPSNVT